MKLFLSYPSAERTLAERLMLALEAEAHTVFMDRSDLPAGEAFHQRLREGIADADAMVFLVTPAAVAAGSYTLAELGIAQAKWRRPAGRVLPVMVQPTPVATLPPYLAAVTLLQPRGEIVAETVAAVARLGRPAGRGKQLVLAALVALVLGAGAWQFQQRRAAEQEQQLAEEAAQAAQAAQATKAAQLLALCSDGQQAATLQQLSALPPLPAVQAAREDCAMRWLREMRASSGPGGQRTFGEQVAQVQPVLLQGLTTAQGQRAADLRAHLGWGEFLRRREGTAQADPVSHWTRALADEAGNVYAHAMWARALLPAQLAEARPHFEQALASGRERAFVRTLQFGGALGGGVELAAYAVTVADAMRRGGETIAPEQRQRLWTYAFGTTLLQRDERVVLLAALPPADLLATFNTLYPAPPRDDLQTLWRFAQATLQAHAGQRDAARASFQALAAEMRAARQSGRLPDETQRALAALGASTGG